ncbi:zinc finger MYM-type protein 1-like [Salvia splendens]|uniref:zinc finger MYM-type protein 1-like n=1 Tax=Salvia splendens TaxID=180675 RepID=UPI001C2681DF|nr:zinc finger MYM-type protein 1-like [Salvia splendens]
MECVRIVESVENQSAIEVELDWNDIDADPGKRKSIEAFDVAIRDRVRRKYLVKGPCQPIGNTYPKKKYDKGGRYAEDAFTKTGFNNWKNALEKFNQHVGAANSCHNNARIQFEAFQDQRHSVANVFRENTRKAEVAYRVRLTASLDMTSPRIQKELANACASEVTLAIVKDIGDRVFTILVDEARDVSLKEQMGVVLRYVISEGYVIERFLGIVHVTDTCSRSLKNAINALLSKHNLSLSRVRGQGYDGASNMRGEFNGLKSLILQENPYVMYFHCFSHQLELIIVVVTKGVRVVKDSFNYISMIVNMVGASCKRKDQLRKLQHERLVAQLNDEEVTSGRGQNQETILVRPGDTRWGSHYSTLLRLCSMWPVVEKVLEIVRDDATILDNRSTTEGLIERMDNYEFVFTLHLIKHLLGTTNELSHALLRKDQNIVQAISLIQSVKHQLQSFREDGWEAMLDQTNRFCELHNISQVNMEDIIPRPGGKKHGVELITNLHHYRVEIFYQVVDLIIQEMNNRFYEASNDLLKCIACLDPRNSFSEFNEHQVIHIATLYPEDFSMSECLHLPRQVSNFIANVRCDPQFVVLSDLGSFSMKMVKTKKHLVFPLVYRIIELALVLPVATASVERAFSAMKTIKTDLRNRMGDEWMNDSQVVYIEKDTFSTIDNEPILQHFQSMKTRRIQLSPL